MANRKDVEIVLGFTADTAQAKTQIEQLKTQLSNLSTNANLWDPRTIQTYAQKAKASIGSMQSDLTTLQGIIDSCWNPKTSSLDLNKYTALTKQYGLSWEKVENIFKSVGSEGEEAFSQLAVAVTQADNKMQLVSSTMEKFLNQLAKSASIQLSYAVLNQVTGTIRNAYEYTVDLNKSLNNIQIVTQKSNSEMASFAKSANKAAQALSSSTVNYSDASLIYYQQGLTDKEVAERTKVTVEMANITGQTASEVSEQLTAIWNNFDGTYDSLEKYADVITALGAATASSSEEISEGLSQFAAVADTVGLSYEYATSALATVVAKTRQSADTVGNSFKTIFARLKSLNQGETLDDDTTLTKYSLALQKVGVDIKDQNGELKNMDTILDELGAKWGEISKEDQNALAYTVAGARQYTNFIALLDDWDYMQSNLDVAANAEGTVAKQQAIYEKSFEAATTRLQAAWEEFYQKILDDDALVWLVDKLTDLTKLVNQLADNLGGLPGILGVIITLAGKFASTGITKSILNAQTYLKTWKSVITGEGKENQEKAFEIVKHTSPDDGTYQRLGITNIDEFNRQSRERVKTLSNYANAYAGTPQGKIFQQQAQDLQKMGSNFDAFVEQSVNTKNSFQISINSLSHAKTTLGKNKYWIDQWEEEIKGVEDQLNDLGKNYPVAQDIKRNSNLASEWAKAHITGQGLDQVASLEEGSKQYSRFLGKGHFSEDGKTYYGAKGQEYDLTDKEQRNRALHSAQFLIGNNTVSWEKSAAEERKQETFRLEEQIKDLKSKEDNNDENTWKSIVKGYTDKDTGETKQSWDDIRTKVLANISDKNGLPENFKDEMLTYLEQGQAGAEEYSKGNLEQLKKAIQGIGDVYERAGKQLDDEAQTALAEITKQLEQTEQEQTVAKIQSAVQTITQLTGVVTTLSSAINSWDDDKNIFENLASLLPALVTTIPVLMNLVAQSTLLAPALDLVAAGFEAVGIKAAVAKALAGGFISLIITGIIALGVKLYNFIQDNTPEAKLEKLQEGADAAATAAENAANEYTNLKNTLDGLGDKYDALEKLTKGTLEWQDAVNDINDSLREVITTYNLIYDTDWYYDKNGVIKIRETAQDTIRDQAQSKARVTSMLKAVANNAVDTAKNNQSIKEKKSQQAAAKSKLLATDSGILEQIEATGTSVLNDSTSRSAGSIGEWIEQYKEQLGVDGIPTTEEGWQNLLATLQTKEKESGNTGIYTTAIDAIKDYLDVLTTTTGEIASLESKNTSEYQSLASAIIDGSDGKFSTDQVDFFSNFLSESFNGSGAENQLYNDLVGNLSEKELNTKFEEFLDKQNFSDSEREQYEKYSDEEKRQALYGYEIENMKDFSVSDSSTATIVESKSYDEEATQSEIDSQRASVEYSEEELELYTDLMKAKYNLADGNKEVEQSYKLMALRQISLNQGLEDLSDSWDDYSDALSKNSDSFDELSDDYIKGLAAVKSSVEKVFGVDLSTDFIRDHLEEIEDLAEGDISSLDELGKLAAKDYISNLDISEADGTRTKDGNLLGFDVEEVRNQLNQLIDEISAQDNNIEIGATIDVSDIIDKLNQAADAGQITAEQMQAALNSVGYTAEIGTDTVQVDHVYHWTSTIDGEEGEQSGTFTATEDVQIPTINGETVRKVGLSNSVNAGNRNKGSSSGSGSSSKDKKNANDEIERYHHIKNVLEDLEHELDLISDAKDRAFGSAKLKLIDKEIAKYQDLLSAQESYLSEIKANYASDQAVMAGYGATFDEFGNISNYVELMTAQLEKYNSTLTDEAEEEYENFKSALELYEETQDLYKEQMEQWHEYRQAIFDAQLEKIEYKLEFVIDIDDEELKYLEYLLDELDDAAYDSAEAIANLGKQIDIANDKSQAYTNSVQELMDVISPGNGESLYNQLLNGGLNYENLLNNTLLADEDFDSSKWLEDLQEAYDGLIEQQEQFSELWDDYIEKMENFWDEWKDKFDTEEERLDFLKEVASNYKNLIDILGKDNLGISTATLNRLDDVMSSAAVEKASASYQEYLKSKALYEDAVARGLDTELIDYYKEAMQEAYQDMQSDQADAAQQLEDEYTNAIDRIFEEWEDGISGIEDSLSDLANQFEMQNTIKDLYLDTYDQAYQTAKLTKDIADSIQDTDVISDKQELASLMDEINEKQASGAKMSQYELDAYQKEYELLLAKAALEDAQNAKNQVRMTRDAEGNMSYTYTADGNAISEAEDNYNDVAYQFAQLNVGQINDAQQQILQLYQDMEDALKDIDESDADRRQAVVDDYMTQIEYWEDQMQIAFDWNADLTDQTGYLQWDLADNFADTVLSQVTGYQTLEEMQDNFENSTRALLDNLADADQEHQDKVSELLDKTGMDADDMEDTVNEDLDEVQDGIDDTIESVEEMGDQFDDTLDDVMDEAEEFESTWDNVISAVIANNNELISSISSLLNYYKQLTSAATEAANAMGVSTGTYSGSITSGSNPSGSGKTPTSDKDINTPTVDTDSSQYWIIAYNSAGTSLGKTGPYSSFTAAFVAVKALFSTNKSTHSADIIDDNGNIIKTLTNGATKIGGGGGGLTHSVSSQLEFDTGGYTGDWGSSEGRIATLHEKELVLNKTDTANMLNIVEMVRGIVSGFGNVSHGANANFNLGLSGYDSANSQFEQSVTINADFSGVSSRDEIQAAFDQMALQATQYMKKSK